MDMKLPLILVVGIILQENDVSNSRLEELIWLCIKGISALGITFPSRMPSQRIEMSVKPIPSLGCQLTLYLSCLGGLMQVDTFSLG